MTEKIRQKILSLLAEHRIMTIATLRPDGWPQATTVGYASEGLSLYFACSPNSQKAANLARDDRISLTIDHDPPEVRQIIGLSMAARATPVTDPSERERAFRRLAQKYPDENALPASTEVIVFRVTPTVISVIDNSIEFGHTDLVEVTPG